MLNLEPADLESIHRSAVESAELLRRSGERAKAARLESLARIVAQELARRRDPAAGPAPEMVQAGPRATTTFG